MIVISAPLKELKYSTYLKTPSDHSFDNLITYTASIVKTLLECSKERIFYQQRLLPTLPVFIRHIIYRCKLEPATLVVAIIYLDRLKQNLPRKSKGGTVTSIVFNSLYLLINLIEFDTPYKMFIASAILAAKFIEDSNTIAQSIYRLVSPLYNSKEISEMERSFLGNKQRKIVIHHNRLIMQWTFCVTVGVVKVTFNHYFIILLIRDTDFSNNSTTCL